MSDAPDGPLAEATPPEAPINSVRLYRCPHCGQTFFAFANDPLPQMCAYCQDMTTWQPHKPPTP